MLDINYLQTYNITFIITFIHYFAWTIVLGTWGVICTAYLNIALITRVFLAREGCISQREGPRYHRIFLTLSVLIKRKTRHSSTCLEVGRHFKLLCACAYIATTWHCHGCQVTSFSGFPPGNEASRSCARAKAFLRRELVDFCFCLRHKRLKRVEFTRVLGWQRLREVICLQRR